MLNILSEIGTGKSFSYFSRLEIYMKRLRTQQELWSATRRDMPSVEVLPICVLKIPIA